MKNCPFCNAENEDTAAVCADCGREFEENTETAEDLSSETQNVEAVYEVPSGEFPLNDEDETQDAVETVVKEKRKNTFALKIVVFALITAIGLGLAAGSYFYVRPKYNKKSDAVKNDMASYGLYYGLYQVYSSDQTVAATYGFYAQSAAQKVKEDENGANKLLNYLYICFAASGVLFACGLSGLLFTAANREKKEKADEPTEEYIGQFDDILGVDGEVEETAEELSSETEEISEETVETEETEKVTETAENL